MAIIKIVVNGTRKAIDADKVPMSKYSKALAIGLTQLIHKGKLLLADVEVTSKQRLCSRCGKRLP